jgi:stringent starvation protein B
MNSTKPYLIRAFYAWIVDNKCTPYVVVNANCEDTEVPLAYVENGQIVLNIAKNAVQDLDISNERIFFEACFNKISQAVHFPVSAVMAIYAKENGRGMVFAEEDSATSPLNKLAQNSSAGSTLAKVVTKPNKSHLSLVKSPEIDE